MIGNGGSDTLNGGTGQDQCNGGPRAGDTATACETVTGVAKESQCENSPVHFSNRSMA
jgi:hypothetical protein